MMAFVFLLTDLDILFKSKFSAFFSISTRIGFAPVASTEFGEATNVRSGTTTSSPLPIF